MPHPNLFFNNSCNLFLNFFMFYGFFVWRSMFFLDLVPKKSQPTNQPFIFCIVKGSRSNCCRTDRPRYFKRRYTVRVEPGNAANLSISWLIVLDVIVRFCRTDFTMCLSSRVLVVGGHWSRMLFSMTLNNPLIPYSHDRGRMSTSVTGDITER